MGVRGSVPLKLCPSGPWWACLPHAPLLHDCRLHIPPRPASRFPEDHVRGMPTSILLPRLQEFAVNSDHSFLSPLLDLLDVPMLSKLEVSTDSFVAAPLHALIRRSAQTLRALSLTPNSFKREEFFASMQACADLTELTLFASFPATHIRRTIPLPSTLTQNAALGQYRWQHSSVGPGRDIHTAGLRRRLST